MANNNSPNPNIIHINIIEGLVSELQGHLEAMSARTVEQAESKSQAQGKLSAWKRNELYELRREFE